MRAQPRGDVLVSPPARSGTIRVVLVVRGRAFHLGVQLQPHRATWSEYEAALRLVDELGLHSVWGADHLLPFAGPDDGACFETMTSLSAMALVTSTARVGVLVNGVVYREPAILAKASAQVDQMSGGRLEFGIGAGWAEREFTAYGLPFPDVAERFARLEEAIEVIISLWTRPRTTFAGRYYQLRDAPLAPKPVQSPHPPITLGGTGWRTARLAARFASRLNVVGSPQTAAAAFERLQRCCEEVGRDVEEVEWSAHPRVAVAASEARAEALARRQAEALGEVLPEDRSGWIVGTPPQAIRQLKRYAEVGVSHVVLGLGHPFDAELLHLLATEVLPGLS